jgi:hypothetical protein
MATPKRATDKQLPYGKRMILERIVDQWADECKASFREHRNNIPDIFSARAGAESKLHEQITQLMQYGTPETEREQNARANEWIGEGRAQTIRAIQNNINYNDFSKWTRDEATGFLCRTIPTPALGIAACCNNGMKPQILLLCKRIGEEILRERPGVAFHFPCMRVDLIDSIDEYDLVYFRMDKPMVIPASYNDEIANEIHRVLDSISKSDYSSWKLCLSYPAHLRYRIKIPLKDGQIPSVEMKRLTLNIQQHASERNKNVVVHVIAPPDDDGGERVLRLYFMLFASDETFLVK